MLPAYQTPASLPDDSTPEQMPANQLQQIQSVPDQPKDAPVQVDPHSPPEEPVFSVDTSSSDNSASISPETADKRAFKFKYGLDEVLKKSRDDIYQGLLNGKENELRETAASEVDSRKRTETEKAIAQIAANKGGVLTPEETDGIKQIIQNLNQKTDPATVLEEAYGKQFIATLDRTADNRPDSFYNDVKQQDPEYLAELARKGGTLVAKRTVLETYHQNIEDEAHAQGWLPWGYDKLKMAIPGYEDIQMRGNVPGVGEFAGPGLGANLEQQRKELLHLPTSEMLDRVKEIVEPMRARNPQLAAEYVKALIGQSTDDAFVNNLLLPTSLIGTGIGAGIAKATRRAVFGAVKPKSAFEDLRQATADMVKASAEPNVSKSTLEAAAGDLQESAITKATTNAMGDKQGLPEATKRGVEALSETFRTDLADIKAGPGRFGQDLVNRIEEQSNTVTQQLFKAATEISKVERLPDVMSVETAVRAVVENMKNTYRGLKNAVIDTTKPYKENLANTWLVDLHLGNNDGTYFTNRSVAENFIKFHGLDSGDVLEGTDVALTKAAKAEAQLRKNIADAERTIPKIEERLKGDLTDEQRAKETSTLNFLRDEAIPGFKAKLAAPQKASVAQQGLGFYVKVTKPINETDMAIRDLIANTKNTQIPDNPIAFFLNNWVGKSAGSAISKYRTPEEVLSLAERQNRLTATYAPSEYFKIMQNNAKEIQALQAGRFSRGRKRWEEWQRVLENAQELPDPTDATGKRKGYFFKSPEELEQKYLQWMGRLPDAQEVGAYFEFKRGMEIDRVFRNMAEHRNQQRVGAETHSVAFEGPDGKPVYSDNFSGVVRRKIGGAEDNIAILGKNGEHKVLNLSRMPTADKTAFQEEMDLGSKKLVELYNPELRELNGFGNIQDQRIRYVLTDTLKSQELDWNHIPRRGGGHVEYDYDHYIKQAKIARDTVGNRFWYEGDTTIMPVPIRKMGEDVSAHLNEVRKLLKDTKEETARQYSNDNLHIDWDTVKGWFQAGKDENGKFQPARLSLDEPIQVVSKGQSINKVDKNLERRYENFKDGTREGSLARQNQVQYSQERDAGSIFALNDIGTKGKPLYATAPANMVDPITTMNRGLTRIAQSNFMDDYKTMSVEHWLKQAGTYLQANDSEIAHSPFYYFNEGKFRPGTDPFLKARLEATKFHINQLVGQPSDGQAMLYNAAQKLQDSMYGTFGPKGAVLTPPWLLHTLQDPFQFIRSVVFDMKLGLFNLPQFIVQAGNYSNIYGIAGTKFAAPGTYAAQLHFWSTVNSHPNIIEHLDRLATKLTLPGTSAYRPGEFKEAFQEMQKTGFGNAAGEYALQDIPTSAKIVQQGVGKFLDWGRYPFKKGEENARYGAWYTAFKEFREENPLGRITPEDRAAILQRADLLNVNMSRASSSAIHKGVFSPMTQFYTYQIRLMELFYGNRLTGTERMRMLATNAALYGIPMATGLTGLPVADYLRQKALEHGYVVGDDYISSMIMEGLPSALGAVASGGGDPKKGTYMDVGPRYGTKGLEFLGGPNRQDQGYLDIIGGPAYSIAKNTIDQSDGFRRLLLGMIKGDPELFPYTPEDLVDPFKEITSVNTAYTTYAAINAARSMSKKDAVLAPTSPAEGIFRAVTGLKDTRIDDIQTLSASLRTQQNYEKDLEKQFTQEVRRGLLIQDKDPDEAKKYFTKAKNILELGQYPENRLNSIVNKAFNSDQALIDKVNFDFYVKKAPDASKDVRMDAYRRTQRIKELRGED